MASVTAPMPVIMHDMPMMSKFVVDFYQQKVTRPPIYPRLTLLSQVTEIKSLQSRLSATAPGEVEQSSSQGARHPGDDRWILTHDS